MKNKQTAVELLEKKLKKYLFWLTFLEEDFKEAKEIEREQHEQTWNAAHQAGRFEGKGIAEENWQTFRQYYNETYNK